MLINQDHVKFYEQSALTLCTGSQSVKGTRDPSTILPFNNTPYNTMQ